MVGREITPTEIGKHSKLIKNAQDEMSTMDVLVCGRCLSVFHFVEEFKQHKLKPCFKENNNVRECNDTKPKIWAFLLWKATQLINNKDNNITSPNSWALYQTWVKMEETLRETWIVAGRTIQSFAKVSQGNLQEMPVKITKTVVNNSVDSSSPGRKPLTQTKPQVANLKPPNKIVTPSSNNSTADSENEASPMKSPLASNVTQKIIKKPITAPTQITANKSLAANTAVGPTAPANANIANAAAKTLTRRAKRTIPNSEEVVEENVEKIVAKRFNPRRRMHEYLVKWENRSLEQNTWEPASHLENVPHLLETFEKQLARQKETRAALQAKQQAAAAAATTPKPLEVNKSLETEANKPQLSSPSERPQRSSKTKAMDQVKQWVTGTNSSAANSPNSELSQQHQENEKDWPMNTSTGSNRPALGGGIKRKLDDSDFNDSNASDVPPSTTNTMEDFEENLIPLNTLKKMKYGNAVSVEVKTKYDSTTKQIKVNGTTPGRTEGLPNSAEVIITQDTNASGVVKKPGFNGSSMNQKSEAQIRVLSKGESAVSNSGIVRVGSVPDISATTPSTPPAQPVVAATATAVVTEPKPQIQTRTQHVRTISTPSGGGGRSTPTQSGGRQQVMQQQQIVRTPGGTTIQRKTVPVGSSTPVQRSGGMQSRTVTQTSPSSGRMIIPRQGASNVSSNNQRMVQQSKAVTPEQKILQLSKSGDLKVTKKVMTRDDVVAQRQQHQQQQQRQRQQSQVHIQKVQQLSGPAQRGGQVVQRKTQQHVQQQIVQQQEEEPAHQAQLCPITGNIIGQEDHTQQSAVLQTQLVSEQHQQQQLQNLLHQEQQQQQQQLHDIDPNLLLTQDQMLTNEDGTPLLVTGEDGTVYQVAGKNAEGQTILVTQGPDGEQQFAYVAAAEGENENQVLTLDNAVAEAVAQLPAEQQAEALAAAAGDGSGGGQYLVKTTQEDGTTQVVTMTEAELAQHQALAAAQQQQQQQQIAVQAANAQPGATSQLCIQTGDGSDGQEANIPAEVVQAELPSPGGTRRVVLLLQDGTFMMTEMHDDEFKALNIAA